MMMSKPPTDAELQEWAENAEGQYYGDPLPRVGDADDIILRLVAEVRRLKGAVSDALDAVEAGLDHAVGESIRHHSVVRVIDGVRESLGLCDPDDRPWLHRP